MKVTLKSLQAKYAPYGITIEKSNGNYWIIFEGVNHQRVWGRAYVREASELILEAGWLDGRSCELPTIEIPEEIGLEAEKRFEASLDSSAKECNTEKVEKTTEGIQMQPTEISFFQDVLAMNTRVSDEDLNDFEASLQEQLTEEPKAEEVSPTPLEVRQQMTEIRSILQRQTNVTFDRYPQADGSERFVVYYLDWERLGSLEMVGGKWLVRKIENTPIPHRTTESIHYDPREAVQVLLGDSVNF